MVAMAMAGQAEARSQEQGNTEHKLLSQKISLVNGQVRFLKAKIPVSYIRGPDFGN